MKIIDAIYKSLFFSCLKPLKVGNFLLFKVVGIFLELIYFSNPNLIVKGSFLTITLIIDY